MKDSIDAATLARLADIVLQNPLLMLQLRDQVYELMLDDIRYQRDRTGQFRRML
ncbi:MAG: hypothetical protein ACFB8W_10905 [Elainellaceae cyanobacterium]